MKYTNEVPLRKDINRLALGKGIIFIEYMRDINAVILGKGINPVAVKKVISPLTFGI